MIACNLELLTKLVADTMLCFDCAFIVK